MGLIALSQMGVLEIHPWGSTIDRVEKPDILIFDLDPAEDVEWVDVVNAAFDVKKPLAQLKLKCFLKTTGGKGLHVCVPIKAEYTWEDIKNFTRVFVECMVANNPDKYVATMTKKLRKGKIFIDYLRNQRGATAVAPYSTRARIHAPVSVPIDWKELTHNRMDTYFDIFSLPKRLAKMKVDPWKDFYIVKQSLKLETYK